MQAEISYLRIYQMCIIIKEGRERMGKEVKKTVSVPSEIAQNLKVAEEDDSARYDEAARNLVAQL